VTQQTTSLVQNRFDAKFLKASLLRLILEPHLITKFKDFLYPELFDIQDNYQTMKRLASLVIEKSKTGAVSIEAMFGWLQMYGADGEEREATINMLREIQLDDQLYKYARSDQVFESFLQYLKSNTFIESHRKVKQKFDQGDFESAYTTLEGLIGKLKTITLDNVEDANWEESLDFLETESKTNYGNFHIGLNDFDENGGLEKQSLSMFISTSGGGKSMMSVHMIRQAIKQGKKIYLCCLEDRKSTVLRRVYAAMTGLPINSIKRMCDMLPEHRKRMEKAKIDLEKYVTIEFMYGVSPTFILERVRELMDRQRINGKPMFEVVVIDYLQHVGHLAAGDALHEKLHRANADFKDFVLKHNVAGITHFQVNRTGANKVGDNGLIDMSMIAGSYNACFVADTIFSINRSPKQREDNKCILYVLKGREGCAEHKYEVDTEFDKARFVMETALRLDSLG